MEITSSRIASPRISAIALRSPPMGAALLDRLTTFSKLLPPFLRSPAKGRNESRSPSTHFREMPVSRSVGGRSPTRGCSPNTSTTSIASSRSANLYEWARIRRRSSCVSSTSFNESGASYTQIPKDQIKEGNAFISACTNGNAQKVREMLDEKPLLVNYVEPFMNNYTPLHYAAQRGKLDIVMALVEKGADVNAVTYRYTPLHLAAAAGHEDIIRYLEKQPNMKLWLIDANGRTFEDCWNRPEGKRFIDVNVGLNKSTFRNVQMSSDFYFDLKKSDRTQRSNEETTDDEMSKRGTLSKRIFRKILK
ncbi:hypothetical protein L596_006981 [Steinernema carpocapsae]|uniref:Uncharacterized protein n=1 Tax=Steinernema carpocapsae TaxID=34508 RepID=A0A4U5P894_STECR|nr:hypothetical protein L596_006981 [Steinernema carpocapsae]